VTLGRKLALIKTRVFSDSGHVGASRRTEREHGMDCEFLPGRDLGPLFVISDFTASRWRQDLEQTGLVHSCFSGREESTGGLPVFPSVNENSYLHQKEKAQGR